MIIKIKKCHKLIEVICIGFYNIQIYEYSKNAKLKIKKLCRLYIDIINSLRYIYL